jgi:diadenosine tetraphosphate (Ap4A) HIT family hydrolase
VERDVVLEQIWNGWRHAYVTGQAGRVGAPTDGHTPTAGSVFTQILNAGLSDVESHIIRRGTYCFAIMNAFPYTTGHLMVLPYRELSGLEELTPDEHRELWSMVTQGVATVKAVYSPGGVNVGINLGVAAGGSVSEHLHVHVVPRWNGDGNFMLSVANARTLPEPLESSAARLRAAWAV